MNCYFHADRIGVTQCKKCKRVLCEECATKRGEAVCDECAARAEAIQQRELQEIQEQWEKQRKSDILLLVLYLISAVVVAVWVFKQGMEIYSPEEYDTANRYFMSLMLSGVSGFIVPACFLGIPYGWRFLTKLGILDIFMVLPIIGWIFCWTIKLVFSMLIGVVIVYKRIIVLIFNLIREKIAK